MSPEQQQTSPEESKHRPFLENFEAAPFWENLKEHRLTVQRCNACGRFRFPPQVLCPACHSLQSDWVPLSGKGKIYSYVIYHRAWQPYLKDRVPYAVALIELQEGVRMWSNIVGCSIDEIHVEMPVEVLYEDNEGYTLPKFKPRAGQS